MFLDACNVSQYERHSVNFCLSNAYIRIYVVYTFIKRNTYNKLHKYICFLFYCENMLLFPYITHKCD